MHNEQPSKSLALAANSGNALTTFKAIIEESPEILTGILGSVVPGSLLPVKLFHATVKGQFIKQLLVELEEFRKKGQIQEDYLKSEHAWACFSDLLDHIDRISPDPKRYDSIRAAFLNVVRSGETGHSAPYAQQQLRVIYGLSSGEIVALGTIYQMG